MTITTYDTYTLSTEEELARCLVFHVDQFNWGGSYRPLGESGYEETGTYYHGGRNGESLRRIETDRSG